MKNGKWEMIRTVRLRNFEFSIFHFPFSIFRLRIFAVSMALLMPGCPKEEASTRATPAPAVSPSPSPAPTIPGPPPTPSPLTGVPAAPADVVRYEWSGGLSIYEYYRLAIERTATGGVATFVVKPHRAPEATVTDTLPDDEVTALRKLLDEVRFAEAKTEPRKMRVLDVGNTVLTWERNGSVVNQVTESPTEVASRDLRPLRQWLEAKVRRYLERAGAAHGREGGRDEKPATPK